MGVCASTRDDEKGFQNTKNESYKSQDGWCETVRVKRAKYVNLHHHKKRADEIVDDTEFSPVTRLEQTMLIKQVDLREFESKIKKLARNSMVINKQ